MRADTFCVGFFWEIYYWERQRIYCEGMHQPSLYMPLDGLFFSDVLSGRWYCNTVTPHKKSEGTADTK